MTHDSKAALPASAPPMLDLHIELFGLAAIASGRRRVSVSLPADSAVGEVAAALARECPELVGEVVSDDRSGFRSSYILNVNGRTFVDGGPLELARGDTLLLFSSQAGG